MLCLNTATCSIFEAFVATAPSSATSESFLCLTNDTIGALKFKVKSFSITYWRRLLHWNISQCGRPPSPQRHLNRPVPTSLVQRRYRRLNRCLFDRFGRTHAERHSPSPIQASSTRPLSLVWCLLSFFHGSQWLAAADLDMTVFDYWWKRVNYILDFSLRYCRFLFSPLV